MKRTPRDYQFAACRAVDNEWTKVNSTLVIMATGLGKTVLMSDIASRRSALGAVLCLAHRVELLDQAAEKFTPDLGYTPQVIQADRPVDWTRIESGERVIIGSVQTLAREKRLHKLKGFPFGTIMIDEAHHCTAPSYRRIVDWIRESYSSCKILGVTATKRADKKALGLVFESQAFIMDAADGITKGWLVDPIEDRVIIEGIDFSKIETKINESGEADFDQEQLQSLMIEEKPLQQVAVPLLEKSKDRKSLVFTAGVQHAHILANILNRSRSDSAVAIDGQSTPPGHPKREKAIKDFANGSLQYLCNFGVFTEGFDSPSCSMVTIARPTKSLTILVQMIGRGLRPLPGVVDGHTLPGVRRAAIAESDKPDCSILYFIPKAANIKTVCTYDALGGNYDDETRELAKKLAAEKPNGKVLDELKKAHALHRLLAEEEARKKIKADVHYRTERIGEYSPEGLGNDTSNIKRGGASDKQIQMLLDLGVKYETAAGYGARQAHMVIDSIRESRCTNKQRKTLMKFGENPDVNFHEARKIIDEIAANNWQPRKHTA